MGAVNRLNLRFLVHAWHQGSLRRVHIQPHDVSQFAVELRIAAELEGLGRIGLQPVLLPNATHCGRRQSNLLGQTPRTPVGRGLGLAQRGADDRLLLGPLPVATSLREPGFGRLAQSATGWAAAAHHRTVRSVSFSRCARARMLSPAARPSTIRARIASARGMLCVRNHAPTVSDPLRRSPPPISLMPMSFGQRA